MTGQSGNTRFGWNALRFRQQLAIVFCIGILLVALVASTVLALLSGQTIRERFLLEGSNAVETLALQSTLALLTQSAENSADYADMLLNAPDVVGVTVRDIDGDVVLSMGHVPSEAIGIEDAPMRDTVTAESERYWQFIAPVYTSPAPEQSAESPFIVSPSAPELLGHAQVIMAKETLHDVMADILKTNLMVSIGLALSLLAVLLLITRRLTRPIRDLAETMGQAASGEKDVRAGIAGPRDVTSMQHAFNAMMGVLSAREAELRSARDAALESARIKGEFAATVSHELRTPLNGALGMLELLQGMGLTPQQAEYVEVARASGENLLALINDILDFSRNESGMLTSEPEDFDLRVMLDRIVGLTASSASAKGLELGFALGQDTPLAVNGEMRRLQQVLVNLVGNAVKFTERGEVHILVEPGEAGAHTGAGHFTLRFEIQDSGIGIPEEARSHIFEPFRQADGSTTRRYGGTGLGLAICRQIVEFLGGEIGVRSMAGRGSTFWFTLPFSPAARTPADAPAPEAALRARRVLIVDDSDIARRHLRQACESWGLEVRTTESLPHAAELLAGDTPGFDVVLINEALNGTYGRDARDYVATEPGLRRVPIVLLTKGQHGKPRDAAIVAMVEKPIRYARLHHALLEACAGRVGDAPALPEAELPKGASILIVEDNRSNQIVAAAMLERLGLAPSLASGGTEAIEQVRVARFDAILMDCNMPGMDGFQATACIRAMETGMNRRTPIIAMTANVQDSDVERCLSAGMDDYLSKPLNLGALREKLKARLATASGEEGEGRAALHASPTDPLHSLEQEPTLDEEFVEELSGMLGDSFARMVNVFLEDLSVYIEGLAEAVRNNDGERIAQIAHALKGSAGNIGARRLAEICRLLESAGREADPGSPAVLMPLAAAEAERLGAALDQRPGESRAPDDAEPPKAGSYILVVDDDRATRFGLRNVLEEEGYRVAEAADGVDAIEISKRNTPDLVLMDAKMPIMDGFTACQFLKQQEDCAHVPVLIITGLEDDDSIERAFAVGATDYIAKPVNYSVLRRRIAHLLNASRAERDMKRLAYSDALTGMPNRALFTDHVSRLLEQRQRARDPLALMFIDVDRFKLVNDTLGHDAGDMLLKIVAERISNCVREHDLVARLGGDEFTVVIDKVASREAIAGIARKICESLSRPVVFLDREIYVTLSIGVSIYPEHGEDLATLMKHADTAMFQAKRHRNGFRFFECGMEEDAPRRLALESELRRAIERDELIVHYQPQASAATGEITGMEALVRWEHPDRGLISPLDFIPLAEDIGLIDAIGERVLEQACRQLRDWLDRGYGPLRLAVNVSGRQLEKEDIVQTVSDILIATGVPSDQLELEITESVVMEHAEDMIQVFQRFKEMDIHLAIDDFGTGYSSLAYLKRFPVDTIKIDRSFVHDVPTDAEDVAIVTGVIAMARGLGLKVVAEGVERTAQLEFLRERGCDYIQGYCLSPPLPAAEFERTVLAPARTESDAKGKIARFEAKRSS